MIQKNESAATQKMKEAQQKVCVKVKTKGRFHVEIPTNGALNKIDSQWARTANPEAFKA